MSSSFVFRSAAASAKACRRRRYLPCAYTYYSNNMYHHQSRSGSGSTSSHIVSSVVNVNDVNLIRNRSKILSTYHHGYGYGYTLDIDTHRRHSFCSSAGGSAQMKLQSQAQSPPEFSESASDNDDNNTGTHSADTDSEEAPETKPRMSFIRLVSIAAVCVFSVSALGDLWLLIRQMAHFKTVPEQNQYFKTYVKKHPELVDCTGSELKIVPQTTNIIERTDCFLNFSFDVRGQFGDGTVFVERTITDVVENDKENENAMTTIQNANENECNFEKSKLMHLKIYANTNGDLGYNVVPIVDIVRYH